MHFEKKHGHFSRLMVRPFRGAIIAVGEKYAFVWIIPGQAQVAMH
jgi:hypothetical protein